jgi:hypothetical protein
LERAVQSSWHVGASIFKRVLSARFLHDRRGNMPPNALIIIHDFLLRTAFEVVLTDVQAERGG